MVRMYGSSRLVYLVAVTGTSAHVYTNKRVETATGMQLISFHHLPEIPSASPSSPITILNIYRLQTHTCRMVLSLSLMMVDVFI